MKNEQTATQMNEDAMRIIVTTGQAVNIVRDVIRSLDQPSPDKAALNALMDEADGYLVEAHRIQTKIIQNAVEQDAHDTTLLFSHAQDTLMVTKSELSILRVLVRLLLKEE